MLDERRFSFLLGPLDYLKSAALDVLAIILMANLLIMTPGRNLIPWLTCRGVRRPRDEVFSSIIIGANYRASDLGNSIV